MPQPSVPAGKVELGLLPTIGNTVGAFILDSTVYGVLDGGSITASVTWVDITKEVLDVNIIKGYDREFDVPRAGTATLTLRNEHRRFDPSNRRSPIWPGALAGTAVRIYGSLGDGSYTQLFYGQIQDSVSRPDGPFAQTCEISCIDPLANLSGLKLDHVDYAAQLTSTRISNILASSQVQWPYGSWIDTGLSTMIAASTASTDTTISDDCLTYFQKVCLAEGMGLVGITKDGRFRFKNRMLNPTSITYFTLPFGALDSTAHLLAPEDITIQPATSISFSSATTKSQLADVYNSVKVNRATSASSWSRSENLSSQAFLGRKTSLDVDKVLLNDDSQAQALQTRLLNRYGATGFRYDNLIVNPTQGSVDSDKMMKLDVGDLVAMSVAQPAYRGAPYETDDPTERYVRCEGTTTAGITNSSSTYGSGVSSLDAAVRVAADSYKVSGNNRLVGLPGVWDFGFSNGLLYFIAAIPSGQFYVSYSDVSVPNLYGGEDAEVRVTWSTSAGVKFYYKPFPGVWSELELSPASATTATVALKTVTSPFLSLGGTTASPDGGTAIGVAGRYYSLDLGAGVSAGFNMSSVAAGSTSWPSNTNATTWTSTAASVDQYPPSLSVTQYAYCIGLRHSLSFDAQRWSSEVRLAQVGGTYSESVGSTGGGFSFPASL